MTNMQQAIWPNDGIIYWPIYASLGLHELDNNNSPICQQTTDVLQCIQQYLPFAVCDFDV